PLMEAAERPRSARLEKFATAAIAKAIDQLANGKATGQAGIPAEVMKIAKSRCSRAFKILFDFIIDHKVVPSCWCAARIHPVPKKGDLTKISNYRPISLTEVDRKLFESLLITKVREVVEPLSIEQGGFR